MIEIDALLFIDIQVRSNFACRNYMIALMESGLLSQEGLTDHALEDIEFTRNNLAERRVLNLLEEYIEDNSIGAGDNDDIPNPRLTGTRPVQHTAEDVRG